MKPKKSVFLTKVFLAGLLIRLLVMPFTGHWDIRGINFALYNLPYKGALNVYEIAKSDPVDYIVNVNFGREYFIYPPLNYFTLGSFMALLKPFYGQEFATWINGYGNDTHSVISHPHVFRYLFLMKLPYLFFDICLLLLLRKFFVRAGDKHKVTKYWWLNPIVIFLPYMWGQFDLIPAFFVVYGIYYAGKSRTLLAALLFGLGASFKNYPLMLLPLLAIVGGERLRDMIKIFLVGLLPFVVTTLPYWGHKFFVDTVLVSWQSQKMLDFMWAIGGDDGGYPFVIGYALILLYCLYRLRARPQQISGPVALTLLWYYSTTAFHQQWFIWALPILVIYLVKNDHLLHIGLFVVGLFFLRLAVIQADATSELFRFLAPAFEDIPKTRVIMGYIYDIHKLRNIVNSLFLGTTVWFAGYLVSQEGKK